MNDQPKNDLAAPPMTLLKQQLAERAEAFSDIIPKHIGVERFFRTVLMAAQQDPTLLIADRRTFLTACMKAAQDGLMPDGKEAAIVPFKTRLKDPTTGQWGEARLAQYMPMVFGLRKKILQSGEIADLFVQVVYAQELDAGRFRYREGSERALYHEPLLDPAFRPTDSDVALAYSVATFANGSRSFEVMRRWEIDQVREASQAGATVDAKGQPREAKGPWADWFVEMAKKTVLRRHAKSLPQSSDVVVEDVEAADMAHAAASTLQLLDQHPPAPRQPMLNQPEPHDPATGELGPKPEPKPEPVPQHPPEPAQPEPEIVAGGYDPATEALRQQVGAEAPPVAGQVTPDRPTEPPPEAEPEQPEQPSPAEPPAEAPAAEPGTQPAAPEQAAETDEYGITKTAEYRKAEQLAEGYIKRAKECDLLVDLRTLEEMAKPVLETMPEEIAACVDTAFANAKKRLRPADRAGA